MINKTIELAKAHGWFMTRQFENEANPDYHSRTTAREIIDDFAGERLDYWVTGYGTGGTLKGVARVLAKERPETKIVVCEPEDAQLLQRHRTAAQRGRHAGGRASTFKPHPMQGWTPDFIPKMTGDAVAMKVIDRVLSIPGPRRSAAARSWRPRKESLSASPRARPCGRAQGRGASREGRQHPLHAPDTGERYLSTPLFADISADMNERS